MRVINRLRCPQHFSCKDCKNNKDCYKSDPNQLYDDDDYPIYSILKIVIGDKLIFPWRLNRAKDLKYCDEYESN